MMQDCAMQVLEIVMNSHHANATTIYIEIKDSQQDNELSFFIEDNGKGIAENKLHRVTSPFYTTRSTRSVGMGLAFLKGLSEQCNGTLNILSQVGVGTSIKLSIQRNHLDAPPLGDLGEMIILAILANKECSIQFYFQTDHTNYCFSSQEVSEMLNESLFETSVLLELKDIINQGIQLAKEKLK